MPKHCSALAGHDWNLLVAEKPDGQLTITPDRMQVVLLWEILQELKAINARLSCAETLSIPRSLRAINRKTPDPTRKPRTP